MRPIELVDQALLRIQLMAGPACPVDDLGRAGSRIVACAADEGGADHDNQA